MPTTSLEIRAAHAGERRDGNGNLYCILRANHREGSLQNAFASAETATDALKADFMTFRRRVHFVCRGGRDPRRQSLERGIRVGDGMPDVEASAKNWRSFVPHSVRRPCVFCETANPSLPPFIKDLLPAFTINDDLG